MIIALMGATAPRRKAVVTRLQKSEAGVEVFANEFPKLFEKPIKTVPDRRLKLLRTAIDNSKIPRDRVFVVEHLLCHEEAEYLRGRPDVFIWNCEGSVCENIAMHRNDLRVTPRPTKQTSDHVLTPEEALSECRYRLRHSA